MDQNNLQPESSNDLPESKFDLLLQLYLEGHAQAKDIEMLNTYLKNESFIKRLVENCKQEQLVREIICSEAVQEKDLQDWNILQEFALQEDIAPVIELEKTTQDTPVAQYHPAKLPKSADNRKMSVMSLIATAAIVFLVIYIKINPLEPGIKAARLTEAFKTQWAGKVQELPQGSSIFENEVLCLNSGIIELQTENDVNIIIEGPSEFQFKNNREINLNYGHLYSKVREKGSGFMVRTADALIVDLGTEFSVKAGKNAGSTEIQMYKGSAAISGNSTYIKPEIITSGNAISVSSQGELKNIPFSKQGVLDRTISAYEKKVSQLNAMVYHTYNEKNSWVNNYIGRLPTPSNFTYSNTLITEPQSGESVIDYTALFFYNEPGHSYASCADMPVFESGSFTIAIWFKANQKVQANTKQFLASRYDQQTNTGWRIGLLDNRPFMRISDYSSGNTFQHWQSHPEQIDDQWHSLVMVIDREKNKFSCYLDGKSEKWQLADASQLSMQDSEYNRDNINDTISDRVKLVNSSPFYLGIRSNMMCQFEGWIYDIAIWDKALPSKDIREIYTKFPQ